jgi:hypothetical protein
VLFALFNHLTIYLFWGLGRSPNKFWKKREAKALARTTLEPRHKPVGTLRSWRKTVVVSNWLPKKIWKKKHGKCLAILRNKVVG